MEQKEIALFEESKLECIRRVEGREVIKQNIIRLR